MMIPGIAGIGKTSMAAKVIESLCIMRTIYHRCQDWEEVGRFGKHCRLVVKYW